MKPTADTVQFYDAARLASCQAQTCLHFGMHQPAAEYADKAHELRAQVKWERHEDTEETGFDV